MILYVNGDSHTAAAEAVNAHAFAEDDPNLSYLGRIPHPENLAVSWGRILSNTLKAGFHCDAESARLAACRYVDEVVVYQTEQDLVDLLLILPVDVRILGVEYAEKEFTGKRECYQRGIECIFNSRDHSFSSSSLRKRVVEAETLKVLTNKN